MEQYLFNSKYNYKENRSPETALRHLVTEVKEQMEFKSYRLEIFLNIVELFDETNYVIGKAITRKGFPETIIH